MSLVVLEVADKELTLLVAKPTGKGVEILHSETVAINGEGLGGALAKLTTPERRLTLVLPRPKTILRDFQIPLGTPDEIIQMVRFQVEKELPLAQDQMRYSFVETHRTEGTVHVQVAAVPHQVLTPILEALVVAGFKVECVTVSTFGLANLVSGKQGGPVAVVGLSGGALEVLIADGKSFGLSRSASIPAEARLSDVIVAEVDRTVLAFNARSEGRSVSKIIVPSTLESLELNGELVCNKEAWKISIAPLVGLCLGMVTKRFPIPDLLHPPVIVKRFRVPKTYRIAALTVVILGLAVAYSQKVLADRQTELTDLRQKIKSQEPEVNRVKRMDIDARLAREWRDDRFPWAQFFKDLHGSGIKTEELYITSTTFNEKGGVTITGKASSPNVYEKFREELKLLPYLQEVETGGALVPGGVPPYRNSFTLKAQLVRP